MRELVEAWPPGASASNTTVSRPSEAEYTAAASPGRPGSNDDNVGDVLRVNGLGDAQTVAELARCRAHQDAIVAVHHHRCVIDDQAQLAQPRGRLSVDFGIGEKVGLAVAAQEPLQVE